jgi:hypothetical protein
LIEEPAEFQLRKIERFVDSLEMKSKRSKEFAFLSIPGKNIGSSLFFEDRV